MAWLEKRDGTYFITYRDERGKKRRIWASPDKVVANGELGRFETAQVRGEQYSDPYKEHRGRPLKEHVADYIANLRALGRDDMYVYNVEKRLAKLIELCGWKVLGDITADSFCRWREVPICQKQVESDDRKIGPRTLNQYLETARAFCRWCVKPAKRMPANPLADVEKVDETADVRRARRALSEDELSRLLAAVDAEYQLAYRLILGTGLRRDEARQLQWGDVHLNSPSPFIALRAETTKAGRADILPIRADLAKRLKEAKGDAGDGEQVCRVPSIWMHRKYITAAGIPWKDEQDRRADFHALRHTYGTLLSKSGVAPRVAMSLMRHTDLRLTMKVYTDPRIFDLAGAVEKMPALPDSGQPAQQARATGTEGKPAD